MEEHESRVRGRARRVFLKQVAGLAAGATFLKGTGVAEASQSGSSNATREGFLHRALNERASRLHGAGAEDASLLSDEELLDLLYRKSEALRLPGSTLEGSSSESDLALEENPVLRMQRELQAAMKKPVAQRRWVMVIDLRKCIGCDACTVGCKAENRLPPGVVYRPVIKEEIGTYPNVRMRFVPRPCMQCANPPCVPVCPVGATYKRPDGIVAINYDTCIGCRYCVTACPYQARTFDFGDYYTAGLGMDAQGSPRPYETSPGPEYGRAWDRSNGASPVGNVRKCQFCIHRLDVGMLPACVTTCVGVATYFGDANDPESLVSELIVRPNVMRLKEEQGTEPKVYYLV